MNVDDYIYSYINIFANINLLFLFMDILDLCVLDWLLGKRSIA